MGTMLTDQISIDQGWEGAGHGQKVAMARSDLLEGFDRQAQPFSRLGSAS